MARLEDLRVQAVHSSNRRIEVIELKPQKDTVSACDRRISQVAMMMRHVPLV